MQIKTVGIFTKRGLTDSHDFLKRVIEHFKKHNIKTLVCANTADILSQDSELKCAKLNPNEIDLLLVLGGDGTILRLVHELKNLDLPILGINLGTLGFLSEFSPHEVEDALDLVLNGKFKIDTRLLLDISVERDNKELHRYLALNEAVIARESLARVITIPTEVNGQRLAKYIADGLIIATPTGSTAYSLSAGGPILHPHIDALILTPIAPHSLTQKPIVIPANRTVSCLLETHESGATLTLDGQIGLHLEHGDKINITKSSKTIRFARLLDDNFIQTLQGKISFGKSNI